MAMSVKADEVEHQDGRLVEPLRRREAGVAHLLVHGPRHDVEEELLDPVLLPLQVAGVALDHLRVGVEEILRLPLLADVVHLHHEVPAAGEIALLELAGEAHLSRALARLGVK
jgi:hypothetical protein